ncbi:MAG: class I SAM-dependent methyltransferase [Pseudomonadota bacterium]
MNRELTNKIRFIIEDLCPAFLRDSAVFRLLAKTVWGPHIDDLARFRERAAFLTEEEYEALYRHHPRVHDDTDNSAACIRRIAKDIVGTSVCDIGCGTGHLLKEILKTHPDLQSVTGVDLVIDGVEPDPRIRFESAKVEALPFEDNAFDTVICTHVIEHILDYRAAIAELRRITAKRLIIIVPREREYRYTFNPHFNFFPYTHSFLRAMHPVPSTHKCEDIQRDIYYCEDMPVTVTKASDLAA